VVLDARRLYPVVLEGSDENLNESCCVKDVFVAFQSLASVSG